MDAVAPSPYQGLPDELRVESADDIRIVTLNRPARLNAINGPMHEGLVTLLDAVAEDASARALLILAEGPMFCAGGDYQWFRELVKDEGLREKSFRDGRRILDRLIGLEVPVICGIRGGAVGLGASLGVLADLVVMADDGFYRDSHVAIGLVPGDGGVVAWPRSVSLQIAKEYLLLGDRLSAQRAFQLGMVNRVVEAGQVDQTARELAERVAALPRQAVAATKNALNMHLERDAQGVLQYALAAEMLCHKSDEFTTIIDGFEK